MVIVAPSTRNNNPEISDSFLIKLKLLFIFWSWITSWRSLGIRFMFGSWYHFDTFLSKSSTLLNLGFWDRLKYRPSEIMRPNIATVRRVSLEVAIFYVLWSPIKILNLSEEWFDCFQVMCYRLCWRIMYQLLQWYFMSKYPWSYTGYLTQQLLMNYLIIVILKRCFLWIIIKKTLLGIFDYL